MQLLRIFSLLTKVISLTIISMRVKILSYGKITKKHGEIVKNF